MLGPLSTRTRALPALKHFACLDACTVLFGQDESLWVWNEKKACSLFGAHVSFSTILPEDAG